MEAGWGCCTCGSFNGVQQNGLPTVRTSALRSWRSPVSVSVFAPTPEQQS